MKKLQKHKFITSKIRKNILERTYKAKSSYIGSCLSIKYLKKFEEIITIEDHFMM